MYCIYTVIRKGTITRQTRPDNSYQQFQTKSDNLRQKTGRQNQTTWYMHLNKAEANTRQSQTNCLYIRLYRFRQKHTKADITRQSEANMRQSQTNCLYIRLYRFRQKGYKGRHYQTIAPDWLSVRISPLTIRIMLLKKIYEYSRLY